MFIIWIRKQKGYCHPLLPKAQNYTFRFQQKTCKNLTEIMIACPSNGCQVQRLYIPFTPTVWMMLLERKKSNLLCMNFTVPRVFFLFPHSLPSKKKRLPKRKRFLNSRVSGQILQCIGWIYHSKLPLPFISIIHDLILLQTQYILVVLVCHMKWQ